MKKAKIILSSLAILLLFTNYSICEYFFGNDIKNWWALKVNIYAIILGLVFMSQSLGTKGLLRFVLDFGVGISISSAIDKIFFDVHNFTKDDIIMLSTTFLFAGYNYLKNRLNPRLFKLYNYVKNGKKNQ